VLVLLSIEYIADALAPWHNLYLVIRRWISLARGVDYGARLTSGLV